MIEMSLEKFRGAVTAGVIGCRCQHSRTTRLGAGLFYRLSFHMNVCYRSNVLHSR
jgi:hypothetical protein